MSTERYHFNDEFLESIISVAADSENPFNAEFLHRNLKARSLAERDAWWTIFINKYYSYEGPHSIHRILNWSLSNSDRSHVESETLSRICITLSWFLTASNRYLRDRSTKALVNLLENNVPVLLELLERFWDVNDLYVLERLLAVAYAVAMRSEDATLLTQLAGFIYEKLFVDNQPIRHIMIRDYGRGVISCVNSRFDLQTFDISKITPPYDSGFINVPPELEVLRNSYDEDVDGYKPWQSIWSSVTGMDFARYIIEPTVHNWSDYKFGEEVTLSPSAMKQNFMAELSSDQRDLWTQYYDKNSEIRRQFDVALNLATSELGSLGETTEDEVETLIVAFRQGNKNVALEESVNNARFLFLDSLDEDKQAEFLKYYDEYSNDKSRWEEYQKRRYFDTIIVQRWILHRIIELGWTPEKFGEFDRMANHRNYRASKKAERIGKKYQWIALHEVLALLADNYIFFDDYNNGVYRGVWQTRRRDIDPSLLTIQTPNERDLNNWWFTEQIDDWQLIISDADWCISSDNLPEVGSLIEVKDEKGQEWIALKGMYAWESPIHPLSEKYYDVSQRRVSSFLSGYFLKSDDLAKFHNWARTQNFWRVSMPEPMSHTNTFWGELYWSDAYKHSQKENGRVDGWYRDDWIDLPIAIMPSVESYSNEGGYDCSIVDSINAYIPCQLMVQSLDLEWSRGEGEFYSQDGQLVTFDPSINEQRPATLLVDKQQLQEFLKSEELAVCWIFHGEKRIIGGGFDRTDPWIQMNGVYKLQGNKIIGENTFHLNTNNSST